MRLHAQEIRKLLLVAAVDEHAIMTIIYLCCCHGPRFSVEPKQVNH